MNRLFKRLYLNAIYFVLVGVVFVFFFILMNLSQTVGKLSRNMAETTVLRVDLELDNFFDPIRSDLLIAARRHQRDDIKEISLGQFNDEFKAVLQSKRQISSLMISSDLGEEIMLIDMDSLWFNRVTKNENGELKSQAFYWYKDNGEIARVNGFQNEEYDPRERPWHANAMQNEPFEQSWTKPYAFFTTKEPGITVSTRMMSMDSSTNLLLAFDVSLTDISEFTSQLDISKNGFVFVVDEDDRLIGLPGQIEQDKHRQFESKILQPFGSLNNEVINKAIMKWKKSPTDSSYFFRVKGEKWWANIGKYALDAKSNLLVAVVVPEDDFVGAVLESRNYVIIGFIFIFIVIVYVLKAYRDKQRANNLLEDQKRKISDQKLQIQTKNQEIVDSLNYAKRIQSAIMPTAKYFENELGSAFVIYKPKEIIAGDFYWLEVLDKDVLFAMADCTGHGVPGAMVSVVCNNALNRAVREFQLKQPGLILNKVTELVIETFERSDYAVSDGMDIGLCRLNKSRDHLEFAGAHISLWLVRKKSDAYLGIDPVCENDEYVLYEFKGDRQPVGKYFRHEKFKNHDITIRNGDRFYLSSDGYADQFGGPKGKKMKNRSLKEFLLQIQNLIFVDQKSELEEHFRNWKASFEQVDDVCIIGVEIEKDN